MNRCLSVLILMILLAASASAVQLLNVTDLNIYIKGAGLPDPAQEYMIYPDINAEVLLHEGLPIVRQGMSIRLDFNLTSFGTDAVDNRRMFILTQTQLTRPGFPDANLCWTANGGWATIGGGTYRNLKTTHSFIPLNHSDNNAGFTVTGADGDHNSWHWNLNFPVVVEHIGEWQNGISNVVGGRHYVYITTFTPDVANTVRKHAVVPVWLDNEDYEILISYPNLPQYSIPSDVNNFPVGGYRITTPKLDRAASDKLGCSTPGTDTIPHCGEACVSLDVPVADCFRSPDTNECIVEAGPPAKIVPEKGVSKYTPNIKAGNANPYKAFEGSIKIGGSCKGSYPWQYMGPKDINILANGTALIDLNSLANAPEQCTIVSNCIQANRQIAYIYNAKGQAVPRANDGCYPLEALGDVGGIYFNSCCQDIIRTPRACAWYTTTDLNEAEPIHANKYIYLAYENGTITINWRYLKAWSYIDDVIPKGSYFNVKVYKILEDGSRQQIIQTRENWVPYPLTTRDVNAADWSVQFKEVIPFTNTTDAPLSAFDINVGMIKPDNTTPVGGNAGGSVSDCPLPRISKTYTIPSFFWKVVRPGYTCAKSIIDRDVKGKPGKAAKFVCTLPTTPIQKESYAIFDFNQNYPTAGLQSNLLGFYAFDGSNKEPITYTITEDKRTAFGIVFLPLTVNGAGKQYVSELAPDICAKDIIMPGTWPAGIEMDVNPWFTNCGFVNIGTPAGGDNEQLPAVGVGMDYDGDGTFDETIGPYSAVTGTAILADAAHAFSSIGTYKITATADPEGGAALSGAGGVLTALFQAGDAIAEGDETNNVVSGDVTVRPACSTVFCSEQFVELDHTCTLADETTHGISCGNCELCSDIPGSMIIDNGYCADDANYLCFKPEAACPSPNDGCELCVVCANDADCESGNCNAGICDAAAATAGPSAVLNKNPISQDPITKAITLELSGWCTDTISGSACAGGNEGCVSSCILSVTDDDDGSTVFDPQEYVPPEGDVTGVPTAIVPVSGTREYVVGSYTATLTTTSCSTASASAVQAFTVSDNVWPRVDITAPVKTGNTHTIIEGNPVTVQGEISDIEDDALGTPIQYEWSIVDEVGEATLKYSGTGTGAVEPLALDLDAGTYKVVLTATDSGGAQNSASIFINVTPVTGDVKVNCIVPGLSVGEEGSVFGAKVNNTNETPVLNVNVELKATCMFPADCIKSANCTKSTNSIPADSSVNVSCTFGPDPSADAQIQFAKGEQYKYTVKITGVTCSAGITTCNKPPDDCSKVFGIIKLQTIAVPEIPLVFAALAALAVVALLNRRK